MRANLRINSNQDGPLYASFTRLRKFPLDSDSVKGSLDELKEYIKTGGNVYNGQIISVIGDKAYIIKDYTAEKFEDAVIEVADSIAINKIHENIKTINGLIDNIDSNLKSYKEANDKSLEDLNQKIEDNHIKFENDLSVIKASVGANKEEIAANKTAIETNKKELEANINKIVSDLSNHIKDYESEVSKLEQNIEAVKNLNNKQIELATRISLIEKWQNNLNLDLSNYCTKDYLKEQLSKLDLSGYYKKEEIDKLFTNVNTKIDNFSSSIDGLISKKINDALADFTSVYRYRGSVSDKNSLPTENLQVGDVYNLEDTGMNIAWTGEKWDELGSTINLNGYATEDWVKSQNYSTITDSQVESIVNSIIQTKLGNYKTTDELAELYYNKDEINRKLDAISTGGTVDLTNYYKKSEVDEKFVSFDIASIRGGSAVGTK